MFTQSPLYKDVPPTPGGNDPPEEFHVQESEDDLIRTETLSDNLAKEVQDELDEPVTEDVMFTTMSPNVAEEDLSGEKDDKININAHHKDPTLDNQTADLPLSRSKSKTRRGNTRRKAPRTPHKVSQSELAEPPTDISLSTQNIESNTQKEEEEFINPFLLRSLKLPNEDLFI